MKKLALIRESKTPEDNRVALTPSQCRWLHKHMPGIEIVVQHATNRCFTDKEYERAGIEVAEDVSHCDVLVGIKEIKEEYLIEGKTYSFFSHTKKEQSHNQRMLQTIIRKGITLIDFECLEHSDGQRIIGFGFFAGIVGAHNGMMVWGQRTGAYTLGRVHQHKTFKKLMHTYFELKIPNIKIAVTGSGRVGHGIVEIMNLMQIREVEKEDFLEREFDYPVYVHLKTGDLYSRKDDGRYNRTDFHQNPQQYQCLFLPFAHAADILMNGVYWDQQVPRLFAPDDVKDPRFRLQVIADITDDVNGSVPINLGDQTIENPVYGVDRNSLQKTSPYQRASIDIMAVGNLPNELPCDASRYFGEQMIKYVLPDLVQGQSTIIDRATIVKEGVLTEPFQYLHDYAYGQLL